MSCFVRRQKFEPKPAISTTATANPTAISTTVTTNQTAISTADTTNPKKNYNVHLSFCDEDTGSFAFHLYTALTSDYGIIVFWDAGPFLEFYGP